MSTDVDNIWSELETEFESYTPAAPPTVDTNQQVLRKMTVVDRFHRAFFSGWLFAAGIFALTLLALAILGPENSQTGYNPAVASILPGLLVVPLLAPLLANVRKPLWRYALLGPLLAGPFVLAQPATLSLIMKVFASGKASNYLHLRFWNYYIERYLSWPMWVMSALGAAGLAWWFLRRQRALPWFEMPPISKWRVVLAGTLAALPLSLILLAQPLGYYLLSSKEFAYVDQLQDRRPKRSDEKWKPVFSKWKGSLPRSNDLTTASNIGITPKETLMNMEPRALKLLKEQCYLDPSSYSELRKLLLYRAEDLRHPVDVFEALLQAEARCPEYEFRADVSWALANFLQQSTIDRGQLTRLLEALQARRRGELDFTTRMDNAEPLFMRYLSPTGMERKERLSAFGTKVLLSPAQVLFYWHYRNSIRKARAAWSVARTSTAEQRESMVGNYQASQALDRETRNVWYHADDLGHAMSLDSSGDAQILVACLLYKLDHGAYPRALQDLTAILNFVPDSKLWTLQSDGKALKLTSLRKSYGRETVQKEWHLP